MGLLDIPAELETATDGARAIRVELANAIGNAESRLCRVRSIVSEYGRSAIASELGGDAAALLAVYNRLKDAIEEATGLTVDDLPS